MKGHTVLIVAGIALALYFVFKSPTFTGALSPTINAAGQPVNPLTGQPYYAGPAASTATTVATTNALSSAFNGLLGLFKATPTAATPAGATTIAGTTTGPQLPAGTPSTGSYENEAAYEATQASVAANPTIYTPPTDAEILSYESGNYDFTSPSSNTAPDYSGLLDTSGDVIS